MTTTRHPDSPRIGQGLNSAEKALLDAVASGKLVDLRVGDPDVDDPANAEDWDACRNVRAEFLADLLTGAQSTESGRLRAVQLRGARITGPLDLEACKLLCPLFLQDCYFDEPINLDEAEASSLRFPGCRIPALTADQLRTIANVELNDGFIAFGEVRLVGAHIGGQLVLSGGCLANANCRALTADSMIVEQGMFCQNFRALGEVHLISARIGGQLVLFGAKLANENGPALSAERLTIEDDVFCVEGFTARGTVSMFGAHISGSLFFTNAVILSKNGQALTARGLTVEQDIIFRDFTARGEVSVADAHVDGSLYLTDMKSEYKNGNALDADGLTVGKDMICGKGFTACGRVSIVGAHIEGKLDLRDASLMNPVEIALDLSETRVGTLEMPQKNPHGTVALKNSKVRVYADTQEGWPSVLRLRGFVYDVLDNQNISVDARLRWLGLDPSRFTPQLYDQLADVYRRAGEDSATRKILVTKQFRRRHAYSPLNWLWCITVGYGYRTWQAFIWLAALTIAGSLVFSSAYPSHMLAVNAHPPRFQPVVYALDVLFPVVGLGQKSAWQPTTAGLLDWYWALTAAGWVLSAAVVTGLTGILKRD